MQQITLTYRQWMQVHPSCRSIIDGAPHVAAYDDRRLVLMRVDFMRREAAREPRPCRGQLRLRGA